MGGWFPEKTVLSVLATTASSEYSWGIRKRRPFWAHRPGTGAQTGPSPEEPPRPSAHEECITHTTTQGSPAQALLGPGGGCESSGPWGLNTEEIGASCPRRSPRGEGGPSEVTPGRRSLGQSLLQGLMRTITEDPVGAASLRTLMGTGDSHKRMATSLPTSGTTWHMLELANTRGKFGSGETPQGD